MAIENVVKESTFPTGYNHADYENRRRFLRFLLKYIGFTLLAKLDSVEGIENVPASGQIGRAHV